MRESEKQIHSIKKKIRKKGDEREIKSEILQKGKVLEGENDSAAPIVSQTACSAGAGPALMSKGRKFVLFLTEMSVKKGICWLMVVKE